MSDTTPIYNLKAVIHETGLSPETLRAWERRYGLLKPQRSPGGHRLYSQYDIDMLLWLVARQKEGLSISSAVGMWRSLEKDGMDPLQALHTPQILPDSGGTMLDDLRLRWVAACMAFNELAAEQALSQAFAIAAPEIVCIEVIQKGLAEAGQRWYEDRLSVQQEHFISAQAIRRVDALFSSAPPPTRPERILATCPPGEEHSFSLLLISFLLRRRGWDVVYLGPNVPLSRLAGTLQLIAPRLVLSAGQTLNSAASLQEMAQVLNSYGIPLAYGGGIFNRHPAIIGCISGHYLGSELAAVPQGLERLLALAPTPPAGCPIPPEYAQALAHFNEYEARIAASVVDMMRAASLASARLEYVQYQLARNITAALSLGGINYLESALDWLERQLGDLGLSAGQRALYFNANRVAIERVLSGDAALARSAALILEGLAGMGQ
jgi:MerR family transcriptional regulator, light-induced transcriptional regulator